MGKVKQHSMDKEIFQSIFGKTKKYQAWTDETITEGDVITLVNNDCEFSFDNLLGVFQTNLLYCFIVDLEILEIDLEDYDEKKCRNGGRYGYARCRVEKVHKILY